MRARNVNETSALLNLLCICQIRVCRGLWFSLIAVGSDHLAHGIKPDFLKTISDQRADFRPLCVLCAETGIIRTRLGRSLKFSKVGKKSSPILVCPSSLKYRLLVAPERAACRVQGHAMTPCSYELLASGRSSKSMSLDQ